MNWIHWHSLALEVIQIVVLMVQGTIINVAKVNAASTWRGLATLY